MTFGNRILSKRMGSTTMNIPFPTSVLEVEPFVNQLFKLCQNRVRADRIVEILGPSS